MKRLIVTIILAILAIAIAGGDFTYHEVGYHHGHGHGAVIVTRPRPVWCPPHGHGHGHRPGRHWRRH